VGVCKDSMLVSNVIVEDNSKKSLCLDRLSGLGGGGSTVVLASSSYTKHSQ